MTMKIFSGPVLAFAALVLAGCASTPPDSTDRRTAEAEVKMIESQAKEIVAGIRTPSTAGEDKILVGDELAVQAWKYDKSTQLPGFPVQQMVPDSGKVFIPGVGLTEISGKTDDELQASLSNHFSRIQVDPDIKIMPGNEVTIQVWKRDKTSQLQGFPLQQMVPASGKVFIPGVGLTEIAGKTDGEIQAPLSSHFGKVLVEPTVIVSHKGKLPVVQELQPLILVSHTASTSGVHRLSLLSTNGIGNVVLLGWAKSSGIFALEKGFTIRDIIARGGGFNEYADQKKVYIVRGSIEKPEIILVNVANILVGRDLDKNILIQPNDAIYVPPRSLWKVYDEVRMILLPVRAVRETIWESTSPMN